MPSKKKASRRGAADADDRDDMSSVASASTGYNMAGFDEQDDELDAFQAMLDDLFEKRGSTREKALEGLIAALRDAVREEECLANESTMTSRCLHSLRKGSAQEAASAATLLGLHILTLGLNESSSYSESRSDLMKASAQGKAPAVRVAAAEALAIATFVACDDDLETLEVMAHLLSLWRQDSAKVKAAAVAGWSLLFTSVRRGLSSGLVEAALEQLGQMLHAADEADGEWDEQEEDMSLASEAISVSGLDEVVERMQQLASNKGDGVRRSRKGRSSLKSTFRSLVATLEGCAVPAQRVRLQHGDSLHVCSLEGCLQLNALRRFLAGGFQAHLQHNVLLHQVFDFTPLQERGQKLSAREKRTVRGQNSTASKGRARDRGWERAAKMEQRGGW